MKPYITYFKYVLRHKWFVGIQCLMYGLRWRGLIHDWHKFLPSELFGYVSQFGGGIQTGRDSTGYYKPEDTKNAAFELAWFWHQKRASHHWQFWCIPKSDGGVKVLEMPFADAVEMFCDWHGAGLAQGKPDVLGWYRVNRGKMILHPETRRLIEDMFFDRYHEQP